MSLAGGLAWIKRAENQATVRMLLCLLRGQKNVVVIRGALRCLQLIAQRLDRPHSFELINGAMLELVACDASRQSVDVHSVLQTMRLRLQRRDSADLADEKADAGLDFSVGRKLPNFDVVACLGHGDLDIVCNALELVNTLMRAARGAHKKLFVDTLAAVGLMKRAMALMRSHCSRIQKSLCALQRNLECLLPPCELDCWALQAQVCQLKQAMQEKEQRERESRRGTEWIGALSDEFVRVHDALMQAYEAGCLVAPDAQGRLDAFEIIDEVRRLKADNHELRLEVAQLKAAARKGRVRHDQEDLAHIPSVVVAQQAPPPMPPLELDEEQHVDAQYDELYEYEYYDE